MKRLRSNVDSILRLPEYLIPYLALQLQKEMKGMNTYLPDT